MRRFEQATAQGTRFWEIEVVGSELTMRSGRMGQKTFPDERNESYRNANQANREAELLIRKRLEAGFVELIQRSAAADLEDQLAAGDDGAWAVFADQLLAAGDPRGTLIALQRKHGKKRTGKKEIADFIAQHAEELLGPLADYEDQLDLEWANGYLSDAKVFCKATRWGDGEQKSVDQILPTLLEHESSRFLRTLRLGWPEPDSDSSYEAAVDVLVASDWPNHLKHLVVGDFSESSALSFRADYEDPEWLDEETNVDLWPDLRSVAQLAGKAKQLESLRVRANLRRLGVIDLPQLRHLELSGQHLEPAIVDELRRARLPSLTGFTLEAMASPGLDAGALVDVAHGRVFPRLTWLGLSGFGVAAVDLIVRSPLFPRLEVIDLSANELRDEHVGLFEHLKLDHLKKVLLRRNLFSKVGTRELKELVPQADLANQHAVRRGRYEREERYDGVTE